MSTDPPRPACTRDDATAVVRTLRDAGHVAYFAGGCVRDLLLGRDPKDYDVATDAPPARVRQLFRNTQAVGAAFGVILVRLRGSVVEVATFRTDGTYTDGRRPDTVTFATAEEDARRRDFTINGLFMDPLDGDKVIDHVGGRADLDAKLIRAIGNPDERFAEDHLRLLRAVRFAARFATKHLFESGFTIEQQTAEAIRRHAHELPRVSPERIADELRRMLGLDRRQSWSLLEEMCLTGPIFRFLHGGATESGFGPLAERAVFAARPTFGVVLAAIAVGSQWHRAGQPPDVRPWLTNPMVSRAVRGMRQGLKISNEEAAEMEGALLGAGAMLAEPEPTTAAKKRLLATPTADRATDILFALQISGLHQQRVMKVREDLRLLRETEFAPPPLVTGDDLTAAGATPGPAFKRALDAAYDAQLEDRVADKAAALAVALDVIRG